ncbi:hypothetical protein [Virgibacillus sp. JSM 102003]|uniref:hypothetical protein n=1 Tax=Virgibacillus sp. JSM 102003 TaxID=1562108 RepID=UPI0035C0C326
MSAEERIIQEIESLSKQEKLNVLKKIRNKYFGNQNGVFVVGENYDFWLNEKDEDYDK